MIGTAIIRTISFIFRFLPYGLIYFLSDVLAWKLEYLLLYRKKIVRQNLELAFKDKSSEEIKNISHQFYKNLADIIVENFILFSKPKAHIIDRMKFVNPEILDQQFKEKRNIIIMGGHINNWEYPNVAIPCQTSYQVASMVKPITNAVLNRYTNEKRSRTGAKMISTYGLQRIVLQEHDPPYGFVYISDQYPPNQKRAIKASFLGIESTFLHGAQQVAIKKNYPLYAVSMARIKRGFYEMGLTLLHNNPSESNEEELTHLYADFMEKQILKDPATWLWSHKKWKDVVSY